MTVQCSICQTRQEWKVSREELTSLKGLGATLLPCPACDKKTYHVYPSTEYKPGIDRRHFHSMDDSAPRPAPPPPAARAEQPKSASTDREDTRGPRRVPLTLPLRVRSTEFGGFEEVTSTVNVSRGGVYFHTERAYRIGQQLKIILNYNSGSADPLEQRAEVARVQTLPGSFKKGVALKYL